MGTHDPGDRRWLRGTDHAQRRNHLSTLPNPNLINYVPGYVEQWRDDFNHGQDSKPADLVKALQKLRDELDWGFTQGQDIIGLLHGWAAGVDTVLRRLWTLHELDQHPELTLIAVGGFGRRELHPGSDVDLLILLDQDESPELADRLSRFIASLWDIKLDIGHSVRTIEECLIEARGDLSTMTNLLESRVIQGSRELYDRLYQRIWQEDLWPTKAFYHAKVEEQQTRRSRFGDTGYRLEPNIKESPGGLRDFQMIKWVSIRHFSTHTLAEVVNENFLRENEYRTLLVCRDHLWRIRYALHYLAGRKEDRLLFDYQHQLAELFGYKSDQRNKATEQFMREYYRTVMTMDRLTKMVMQLFAKSIAGKDRAKIKEPVGSDFVLSNGYLDVADPGVFSRHPEALLGIFLVRMRTRKCREIGVKTIRLINEHLHLIDESFRENPVCRKIFMDIFREPQGLTHAMRSMNNNGVLGRYMPMFDAITGLMQFDMFHVYTVDEHTLMVLRQARRLALAKHQEEHPEGHAIFQEIPKPEILYLAALFHDIAKGRGGDHAIIGAKDARRFCHDHGMSLFDSDLVAWLVEQHLVMSMTAQRKDISDLDVIRDFASRIETPLRLKYLYLLTLSDIQGTNPTLWNDWKANLLSSLYHRTLQWLTQVTSGAEHLTHAEVIRDTKLEALRAVAKTDLDETLVLELWKYLSAEYFRRYEPDEIVWHARMLLMHHDDPSQKVFVTSDAEHGATEILIYAPSHPGFFMQATRGIEQLGLNIVAAKIYSTADKMALDTFSVLEDNGWPCEGFRLDEVQQRLNYLINNPDKEPPKIRQALPRQLRSFNTPAQITFSNNEEWQDTLLDLSVPDYPGLLADVSTVLFQQGFDLKLARIATVSEQAQDILHIHTQDEKPLNHEQQEKLRDALLKVIAERSGWPDSDHYNVKV